MTPRKRESARERDERIVREAGGWYIACLDRDARVWRIVPQRVVYPLRRDTPVRAAARILNRIAKGKRDD